MAKTNNYQVFVNDELDEKIKDLLVIYSLTKSEFLRTAISAMVTLKAAKVEIAIRRNNASEGYGK